MSAPTVDHGMPTVEASPGEWVGLTAARALAEAQDRCGAVWMTHNGARVPVVVGDGVEDVVARWRRRRDGLGSAASPTIQP